MKKLQDTLYIPDDFVKDHSYYADEKGEKKYTGITTILGIMAKPALIPWAAKMAVEYIKENSRQLVQETNVDTDTAEVPTGEYIVSKATLEEAKSAHRKKKEAAGTHGTDAHALVEKWINETLAWDESRHKGAWNKNAFLEHSPATLDYSPIQPFITWAIESVDHFLFSERPVHSKSLFLAGTIDFGAVMKDGKRRIGDLKTGSGIYYEAILQCEAYQLLAEEEGDQKYDGSIIVRMGKDGTFQTQERERGELDEDAFFGLYKAYRGSQTFIKPKI